MVTGSTVARFLWVNLSFLPIVVSASLPAIPLAQAQTVSQTAEERLNQGLQFVQQGQINEAIAAFRQAAELNPGLAPAHYNLGLALRQQGQLQEAATAFIRQPRQNRDLPLPLPTWEQPC